MIFNSIHPIPRSWQRRVFDAIHGLSNTSGHMTRRLITTRFAWHAINKDITVWAQTCLACQRAKIHHHVTAPLQQFATPNGRFDSIHVDIVDPLPSLRGTSYLFTIIDRFMRWSDAIPMSDATSLSCARALRCTHCHHDRQESSVYICTVDRTEQTKVVTRH